MKKSKTIYDAQMRDLIHNKYMLEPVEVVNLFTFLGYEFFIHKNESALFSVRESSTGCFIASDSTEAAAIQKAKDRIKSMMNKLESQIEDWRAFNKENNIVPRQYDAK